MEKLMCPILVLALVKDPSALKEDMLCRQCLCEWWIERRDQEGCAVGFVARALIHIGLEIKDYAPGKITFGTPT